MAPQNASQKINIRCYGYRTWHGSWVASCIDLSLMVERPSMEESIKALQEQIILYIQSVLDTEDKESIYYLLPRPAHHGQGDCLGGGTFRRPLPAAALSRRDHHRHRCRGQGIPGEDR